MKKLGILLFAFAALSINAVAQKTMAHFNTNEADCYSFVDNNTNVVVKFKVDVQNAQQKDEIATKFKNIKEVKNVEAVEFNGNVATYKVTLAKDGFFKTMEKVLVNGNIFDVEMDGKTMSTKEFPAYAQNYYDTKVQSRKK